MSQVVVGTRGLFSILKPVNAPAFQSDLLIPDLHGHWARFQVALAVAKRFPKARLVFLGDLIDDSPRRRNARHDYREKGAADDSRKILKQIRELHAQGRAEVLLGNHEVLACSAVLDGHSQMQDIWWAHGGRETAASYGWRVNDTAGPLIEDLHWLREHARLWLPVGPPGAQVLASHATRPSARRIELGLNSPQHLLPTEDFDPVVWFPLGEAGEPDSDFLPVLPPGFVASVHGHIERRTPTELRDRQGHPALQLDLHPSRKKLALLYLDAQGKQQVVIQAIA